MASNSLGNLNAIRGSSFSTRGSSFSIRGSSFSIRGSSFSIRGSSFSMRGFRFRSGGLRSSVFFWGLRFRNIPFECQGRKRFFVAKQQVVCIICG